MLKRHDLESMTSRHDLESMTFGSSVRELEMESER